MSIITQSTTQIAWKISFLEKQIQQLKNLVQNKTKPESTSLKGIIKSQADFDMEDFEQAKKTPFKN